MVRTSDGRTGLAGEVCDQTTIPWFPLCSQALLEHICSRIVDRTMNTPFSEEYLIPGKLYVWNGDDEFHSHLCAEPLKDIRRVRNVIGYVEDGAVVMFLALVPFPGFTWSTAIYYGAQIIVNDTIGWVDCSYDPENEKKHNFQRHRYFLKFNPFDV